MATGAYDANGIWQYGEDDNIALFSDTLNLLAESTSDGFTDDRARISTLEAGNLAGIIPVIPSSVTAVTGTAAVSDNGAVTFTGCSKIILNGVFTSSYRHYRLVFNITSNTTVGNMSTRLAVGGTEDSTATNYYQQVIRIGSNSAISYAVNAPGSGWTPGYLMLNATYGETVMDIINPAITQQTAMNLQANYNFNDGSGNRASWVGGGSHIQNTAYDGISFITSGVFTGTVQVFGYND